MFTRGNRNSQTIESTHVDRRKLPVAQQFPGGDDVSALHPLRSSVGFMLLDATESTTGPAVRFLSYFRDEV